MRFLLVISLLLLLAACSSMPEGEDAATADTSYTDTRHADPDANPTDAVDVLHVEDVLIVDVHVIPDASPTDTSAPDAAIEDVPTDHDPLSTTLIQGHACTSDAQCAPGGLSCVPVVIEPAPDAHATVYVCECPESYQRPCGSGEWGCTDIRMDPENCGACSIACARGWVCGTVNGEIACKPPGAPNT